MLPRACYRRCLLRPACYALLVICMACFKEAHFAPTHQAIQLRIFQDGGSTRSVRSILKEVVQPSRLGGAITHVN
jgi:hypothetical protein